MLGRRQVVRHRFLVPAFAGSNPAAPASRISQNFPKACHPGQRSIDQRSVNSNFSRSSDGRAWARCGAIAALLVLLLPVKAAAESRFPPVSRWTPSIVSSPLWESHPAIDPLTGDLWFVRSDKSFSGWRLYLSKCRSGRLSTPAEQQLAGPGLEADPWFSADGKTMWFISTGPRAPAASASLDVWERKRGPGGRWTKPVRLAEPVNSAFAEWFPRIGPDGWLYFGSRRPGGFGKDDIWRARRVSGGRWAVENVGAELNSAAAEYEFEPARSGTWGILSTDDGLVRVVHGRQGWRRAGKYRPEVNSNGTEIGPLILGSGEHFLFSRDTGPAASGEIFVAGSNGAHLAAGRCTGRFRRG